MRQANERQRVLHAETLRVRSGNRTATSVVQTRPPPNNKPATDRRPALAAVAPIPKDRPHRRATRHPYGRKVFIGGEASCDKPATDGDQPSPQSRQSQRIDNIAEQPATLTGVRFSLEATPPMISQPPMVTSPLCNRADPKDRPHRGATRHPYGRKVFIGSARTTHQRRASAATFSTEVNT